MYSYCLFYTLHIFLIIICYQHFNRFSLMYILYILNVYGTVSPLSLISLHMAKILYVLNVHAPLNKQFPYVHIMSLDIYKTAQWLNICPTHISLLWTSINFILSTTVIMDTIMEIIMVNKNNHSNTCTLDHPSPDTLYALRYGMISYTICLCYV